MSDPKFGTTTKKERAMLSIHEDEDDLVERAKDLHDDYTDALDHWGSFADERTSKILLWTLMHQTMTDSTLHYRLDEAGVLPEMSTLRSNLGIDIQELHPSNSTLFDHARAQSYAEVLDFNQEYTGQSHFVEFGRELRQRRALIEITARQYISFLRYGVVKNEQGEGDWTFEDDADVDNDFLVASYEGTYTEQVDRWATLLSRLHESKEGQKYLASLWKGGSHGAPSPPKLIVPTAEEWNKQNASKYFQNSSCPGVHNPEQYTFAKKDTPLLQSVKRFASSAYPGLAYLYASEGDLAKTTAGMGTLLAQFVSDSELSAATSGSSVTVVSSAAAVTSGSPDDVVKLLTTINSHGKSIAEEAGKNTVLNEWLRVSLLGTGLLCSMIYDNEKDNVSSNVKSDLESTIEYAGTAASTLSWGNTANTLLKSLGGGTVDLFGKAGKVATAVGPLFAVIDIAYSVHGSMEAAESGDGTVAFGQAIGAIGAGTALGASIYAAATSSGGFFSSLAAGASGGPITLAIAGALVVGGLALTVWTKDADLTTFFENTRFGTNWEWQYPDPVNDDYHNPEDMWYMWNDNKTLPPRSWGSLPEDDEPCNYARQVSEYLSLLHGVEANAAYDDNRSGVLELKNINATASTLLNVRVIAAAEKKNGDDYYDHRDEWELETRLFEYGDDTFRWMSDPEVDLAKQTPHTAQHGKSIAHGPFEIQSAIVKPKQNDMPETITYWKGLRTGDSDAVDGFEDVFGLSEDDMEAINNTTWNHWLEVSLTSDSLSARLNDLGSGLRGDFSPSELPIAIRARTVIDVDALKWF